MAVSGISDNPNSRANLTVDYLKPEKAVAASDQDTRLKLLGELRGDFERRYEPRGVLALTTMIPDSIAAPPRARSHVVGRPSGLM
jgi:hypothetical protein